MDVRERLDREVDDFVRRSRFMNEPLTKDRARMFVLQHRLNTRHRNSVLKLAVATNTPDWDLRMKIIASSAQEIIADNEYGGGKPHWLILEDLGVAMGMDRAEIQAARPLPSTRVAWLAWEALMKNRHWLEGLVANTCAERANVPGYGSGNVATYGSFGAERFRFGSLFGLADDQLGFFKLHTEADIEHSNLGWNTVAERAAEIGMEDAAVHACRVNLMIWELYQDGIADGGDALASGRPLASM